MLTWAVEKSKNSGGDLVELYCGNGNFTLPLAQNFGRVLATEVATTSVNSALYNIKLNQVTNVAVARMSSEEFSQALNKVRAFYRLKDIDLDSYKFSNHLCRSTTGRYGPTDYRHYPGLRQYYLYLLQP
jgi:tRNA (uracil-5-)-methyltransferase